MHQPTNVGSQLLGRGTGQKHAVVERVQEARFGDPATPLHQLLVHDGDLPRGAAEADETQLEPEAQRRDETKWGHSSFSSKRGQVCASVTEAIRTRGPTPFSRKRGMSPL